MPPEKNGMTADQFMGATTFSQLRFFEIDKMKF